MEPDSLYQRSALSSQADALGFGAFVCGVFFLASALFIRGGLHDDEFTQLIFVWLALGAAATYFAVTARRVRRASGLRVRAGWAGIILIGLGWAFGCFQIVRPSRDPHALDVRLQSRCANNLRFLGMAIENYANNNDGQYPDRPGALLTAGIADPSNFICPSTWDKPAFGETPPAIAKEFADGGHSSYVYVAKGLTTATTQPNNVLMYEPIHNHTRDHPGIHVLYTDDRVEYLQGKDAERLINAMQRGENPPRNGGSP